MFFDVTVVLTTQCLFHTDGIRFFFSSSSSRKWDWLTTTLIMPETTAPTWASRIVVGPPCFQSSNLEMRGQCARTLLSKALSNIGNFWRFWVHLLSVLYHFQRYVCTYKMRPTHGDQSIFRQAIFKLMILSIGHKWLGQYYFSSLIRHVTVGAVNGNIVPSYHNRQISPNFICAAELPKLFIIYIAAFF